MGMNTFHSEQPIKSRTQHQTHQNPSFKCKISGLDTTSRDIDDIKETRGLRSKQQGLKTAVNQLISVTRLREPMVGLLLPHSLCLLYSPGRKKYCRPLQLGCSCSIQQPSMTLTEEMSRVWKSSFRFGQSSFSSRFWPPKSDRSKIFILQFPLYCGSNQRMVPFQVHQVHHVK